MKFNYNYFILGFILFFILRLILDRFVFHFQFINLLWAILAGILLSIMMNRGSKPFKNLTLKLKNGEEVLNLFGVNIKQTKFNWVSGNFFITNKRFAFVDKQRLDIEESDYDIHFHEVKEVIFLPQKFMKNECVKLVTVNNEVFYINAFQKNKELYDAIYKLKAED